MMRIYLIGYMACGKTNLGRELEAKSGLQFVDMDQIFEEKYKISILDFFEKYEEIAFRKLEAQILHNTIHMDDVIIATGGGTPCFYDNMDFILSSGIAVYLRMELPLLVTRLSKIRKQRPLLFNLPAKELKPFIEKQMQEREPFYLKAQHWIDGPDYPVDYLCRMLFS